MKRLLIYIPLLFLMFSFSGDKKSLRKIENKAFQRGEVLKYRVHYGVIDAGEAILEVKNEDIKIGKKSTLHVVGSGRSLGAFNWFFKVEDRYESYLDEEGIFPWAFIRRVDEGGYKISRDVVFNQYKNLAIVNDSSYTVPENCQDILSSFYYARTMNLESINIGDTLTINTFFDFENYPLGLRYVGLENVKSKIGTVRCKKFKPLLQVGRVFTEEEDMTIWISDDECKVPIRLQADVLVGSIKMDIKSVNGLIGELALITDD